MLKTCVCTEIPVGDLDKAGIRIRARPSPVPITPLQDLETWGKNLASFPESLHPHVPMEQRHNFITPDFHMFNSPQIPNIGPEALKFCC